MTRVPQPNLKTLSMFGSYKRGKHQHTHFINITTSKENGPHCYTIFKEGLIIKHW